MICIEECVYLDEWPCRDPGGTCTPRCQGAIKNKRFLASIMAVVPIGEGWCPPITGRLSHCALFFFFIFIHIVNLCSYHNSLSGPAIEFVWFQYIFSNPTRYLPGEIWTSKLGRIKFGIKSGCSIRRSSLRQSCQVRRYIGGFRK